MNVARLDFAPVLQRVLTAFAGHPLLERLFFASLELAVLALLVFAAIRIGRIRSPRLAALLWLLVLGKPLVSLAVGSPFHLFRMEVPAVVAAAPAPLEMATSSDPQVPAAAPSSIEVQASLPVGLDEEMAGAPAAPMSQEATSTPIPSPGTPSVASTAAVPAHPAPPSPPWSPVPWILGIWLTGVACFAGLSLVDRARAWRLVCAARKPEPSLSDRYTAIAADMGLKRPAALRITDEMESPALVGSVFCTIVIPGWLAEDANEAKLDWALRHELMHFRLRDPWAALVRELSQMFFYFHPGAWWAGAKWKTATEKACDRAIVADEAAARDYAEQLYRILVGIHGRRQAALRTGLFATRTQIGQRIAALLYGPRTAPHLSAVALVVVALVTAVTLSVGGAFADKNAKRDEPEKTPLVAAAEKAAEAQPAPVSGPTTSKPEPTPAPSGNAAPGKSRDLQGIVVSESGAPVSGALVTVRTFQVSKTVQTAADGSFSVAAPKPLSGGLLLAADASGGRQAIYDPSVDWSELAKIPAIRLVLKQAREIPVTVNDASGRPVSGAVVAASAYLLEIAKETSDSAGRTVLRVPADAELQSIFTVKPEVGLDYFGYLYPGQIANNSYLLRRDDTRPVKFVLSGAKTARLRFVDASQRPLPGLRVAPAFFQRPRKGSILNVSAPEFKQTTDANGVATFRMIPADNLGFVEFTVSTQEYALPNQPLFDPNWSDREITWVLERKQLLRGSPEAGQDAATKMSEAVATAPTFKPVSARRTRPAAAKTEDAKVNVVHGRVLLPDGKPAAGAKVFALRRYWSARFRWIPLDKTTANADGTFVVRVPKHQRSDGLGSSGGFAMIAAQADGFGARWWQWERSVMGGKDVVLHLVPDSPIHGRIVDLEGKPVRGVQVNVLWQDVPATKMADWLAAVKSGDDAFREVGRGVELPAFDDESRRPTVTDDDGHFTIKGIGADRVARLELRGEAIAYTELDVVTRAIRPISHHNDPFSASGQLFGSEFTYQAAPTQPLVGTVRDAASGAPLAGVRIESRHLAGVPRAEVGALRTQTDGEGRYRLIGLPKANGGGRDLENAIAVVPNDEQPYFMLRRVRVPEAPGLTPATLDFKLTRGLWITGRAVDKATGKPVPCSLMYAPFLSNPLAANLPEFKRQGGNISDLTRNLARPDGTFRIVGLPGRGLVTAKAIGRSYRRSGGATVGMSKDGNYPTYLTMETQGADVAEEINPAPGTESVTRDLAFERGRTIRLSLVDAGGKPVGRCVYAFSRFRGGVAMGMSNDSTIEMTGMGPQESRPLLINASERHLGKALVLHEDDKSPQVWTVTLEPCATVKGRLLDADGVPIKNAHLSATARGGDGYSIIEPGKPSLDADGKFQLTDLPAGCDFYSIHVTRIGNDVRFDTIAEKVVVVAGKTIDLGEIRLKREK
jgi:beta-lactamase regulating signal transducer with metallopeptidase domain